MYVEVVSSHVQCKHPGHGVMSKNVSTVLLIINNVVPPGHTNMLIMWCCGCVTAWWLTIWYPQIYRRLGRMQARVCCAVAVTVRMAVAFVFTCHRIQKQGAGCSQLSIAVRLLLHVCQTTTGVFSCCGFKCTYMSVTQIAYWDFWLCFWICFLLQIKESAA